ncbi:MAG: thioredoxin-dependent thiol peroxidase [Acidimicrobiales bacterium]|jgi:peroxiredoxin Q/BCP
MTALVAGDLAPMFSLPDQDGAMVSLGDFAGRRLVVYFYPADDTPGCTKEACQFSDLVDEYANLGVEVIGISPDGGTKHQKFRAKYGLKIALLSDSEHEVMALYGAFGPKTLYGRKTIGVVRSTFLVGPDGRIEQAWYNVRADGHAAKVLAALAP